MASEKSFNFKKNPPVKVSQIPGKISGRMFSEGIKEMTGGKHYIPRDVSSALKKAGLSSHLSYKSKERMISKREFMKAIKALEEAGVIEHKSGKAAKIYKQAASWESWQKTKARNIERRKEEYRREAREQIDADERRREALHEQVYGTSTTRKAQTSSALTSSAERLKRGRGMANKKDRREYLDNLREQIGVQEDPSKSKWSGGGNRWSGGGSGWQAE